MMETAAVLLSLAPSLVLGETVGPDVTIGRRILDRRRACANRAAWRRDRTERAMCRTIDHAEGEDVAIRIVS